jgi:group II intron reverse transcriptase/maturase
MRRIGRDDRIRLTKQTGYEASFDSLLDFENYRIAYAIMKSKPGNMTPGTDGLTLDCFNNNSIKVLISKLKNQSYQFIPSRRTYISKRDGKLRPLGIPGVLDKMVQNVYVKELEKVYEPIFANVSHGFRPNRSCRTCLGQVRKWGRVTWFIEGDIKSYFDTIDHRVLADILAGKIKDQRLIDLYWKIVKAGYMKSEQFEENNLGIPQGGTISPLLSNIYLNEFDMFMDQLDKEYAKWDLKTEPRRSSLKTKPRRMRKRLLRDGLETEPRRSSLETKPQRMKKRFLRNGSVGDRVGVRGSRKTLSDVRLATKTRARVYYARYADDWLIGITGSIEMAQEIKGRVATFLKEKLKLTLNLDKTHITNAIEGQVTFLGHGVRRATKESRGKVGTCSVDTNKLYINLEKLKKDLVKREMAHIESGMVVEKCNWMWANDEPFNVIERYRSVLINYLNCYSLADDLYRIEEISRILVNSAAQTLALKRRVSTDEIFRIYGRHLTVRRTDGEGKVREVSLSYDWRYYKARKTKTRKYDPQQANQRASRLARVLDQPCAICKSAENVEMHHVKRLPKPGSKLSPIDAIMVKMRRKQIPVCRSCHDNIHEKRRN